MMEWSQRENHVQLVYNLKFKLAISKENITKGRAILKNMVNNKEDLKSNLKMVVFDAQALSISNKSLMKSLKDALYSQKKL